MVKQLLELRFLVSKIKMLLIVVIDVKINLAQRKNNQNLVQAVVEQQELVLISLRNLESNINIIIFYI